MSLFLKTQQHSSAFGTCFSVSNIIRESFHIERLNSTNKLSMPIYRYILKCIYYSLVVFTIVLFEFLLVSLIKFAFYV